MPETITKAFEITNAKISFVSLVNKAANKRQFLITKAEEGGEASFQSYGRILKADAAAHYVTGIVYEPMVEDTQGNYMTAEEIEKAAYGYVKNGMGADLQHNFEPLEGATVVESYVTKSDETINGQEIKKGTWIMTMEIVNDEVFEAITKGEITGFSMGGLGQVSSVDIDLDAVEKACCATEAGDTKKKKKGLLKAISDFLGFEVVEKGAVMDRYHETSLRDNFWNAYYALTDVLLDSYNPDTRTWGPETDTAVIEEALSDFSEIIKTLLSKNSTADLFKSEDGKDLAETHNESIRKCHELFGKMIKSEEETEMTEQEMKVFGEIIKSSVAEAISAQKPVEKAEEPAPVPAPAVEQITKADVEKMIAEAIAKATGETVEEPAEEPAAETTEEIVAKAVAAAMEPFMKQAGLPTNLNSEKKVEKSDETHYLHGYL